MATWPPKFPETPIRTPDVPPLWPNWPPSRPIINTPPHPRLPQPPGAVPGHSGPQTRFEANDRNPVTGGPVWNPNKPPGPLPPGQQPLQPNGQHPITGALLYFRPDQPIPPGWEL